MNRLSNVIDLDSDTNEDILEQLKQQRMSPAKKRRHNDAHSDDDGQVIEIAGDSDRDSDEGNQARVEKDDMADDDDDDEEMAEEGAKKEAENFVQTAQHTKVVALPQKTVAPLPSKDRYRKDGEEKGKSGKKKDTNDENEEKVADDETDDNYDWCLICKIGGDIICCDGCPRSAHIKCVGLAKIPEGDWFCPRCVRKGRDRKQTPKAQGDQTKEEKAETKKMPTMEDTKKDKKKRTAKDDGKHKKEKKGSSKGEKTKDKARTKGSHKKSSGSSPFPGGLSHPPPPPAPVRDVKILFDAPALRRMDMSSRRMGLTLDLETCEFSNVNGFEIAAFAKPAQPAKPVGTGDTKLL